MSSFFDEKTLKIKEIKKKIELSINS